MARKKPGPKPERLKIDGDWEGALRKALRQERPEGGWPDQEVQEDETEGEQNGKGHGGGKGED